MQMLQMMHLLLLNLLIYLLHKSR